jgi:hypothetical protein
MIDKDFYCPKCNELWDGIECLFCGHMSEDELKRSVKKPKKREEERKDVE